MADAMEVARVAGAERFHFVGESVGGTVGPAARQPAPRGAAEPDRVERLAPRRLHPAGARVARLHPRPGDDQVGRDDDAAAARPRAGLRGAVPLVRARPGPVLRGLRARSGRRAHRQRSLARAGPHPGADAPARPRPEPVRAAPGHGGDARGHPGLGARRLPRRAPRLSPEGTASRAAGRSAPSSTAAPPSPMPVSPAVAETTDALLAALLGALERMSGCSGISSRRSRSSWRNAGPARRALAAPLPALEAAAWPDDLVCSASASPGRAAGDRAHRRFHGRRTIRRAHRPLRALRRFAPLQEALYPLAPVLEPVSRWFLEPGRRGDDVLVRRLRDAALREDGARVGVLHARNERGSRGGFSLYVPETWDGGPPVPLVVALHGGSGHGRDFLWTGCARRARAACCCSRRPRGTARGRSWAGRTWTRRGSRRPWRTSPRATTWTARACCSPACRTAPPTRCSAGSRRACRSRIWRRPAACSIPFLLARGDIQRARGRPIYLVHGALDWMFPVQTARMGGTRSVAGARVVYREIEDLSHTYPRDENPRILDWLLGPVSS